MTTRLTSTNVKTDPSRVGTPASHQKPREYGPGRGWSHVGEVGWNRFAVRYVYAPTFTWEPVEGAAAYILMYAHENDRNARTVRLAEPTYDMSPVWRYIEPGPIDMIIWAVDAQSQPLTSTHRGRRFWKAPGYDGIAQAPVDYAVSLDRAMAYLLAPARDTVYDFEEGMPRCCWSNTEDSCTGGRRFLAFPALHHPSFMMAFLDYASHFPASPHAPEAVRQARQYGDWLLEHHHPAEFKCSKFPFSTISHGRYEGYIEGGNITLFRAARVGEAMVKMYKHFGEQKYLDYARHLADVYLTLQRPDGSWPFRVDPKDGRSVEEYTSNAITPARLFGLLEEIEPKQAYAAARENAAKWMLNNPVRTRRWEGMYEDVRPHEPYRNLQHYDVGELIRYLIHFHREDAASVRIAEDLNRYIEDLFVVWQVGDRSVPVQCPTPTVLEQFACFDPMEVHTARWIKVLVALHRATEDPTYLEKAINAGNSIVEGQQANGSYSTWGKDVRFGRPLLTVDWPGCGAYAVGALVYLKRYIDGLPAARHDVSPI